MYYYQGEKGDGGIPGPIGPKGIPVSHSFNSSDSSAKCYNYDGSVRTARGGNVLHQARGDWRHVQLTDNMSTDSSWECTYNDCRYDGKMATMLTFGLKSIHSKWDSNLNALFVFQGIVGPQGLKGNKVRCIVLLWRQGFISIHRVCIHVIYVW